MGETFDEVIHQGVLMSDPSLLVTNPTPTDPSVAPAGRQTYYVLAPTPNLDRGAAGLAGRRCADRYADALIALWSGRATWVPRRDRGRHGRDTSGLGRAGHGGRDAVRRRAHVPADRAVPPRQPAPRLENVVFVGSGTQPGVGVPMVLISGKLAAARITEGGR